MNDQIPTTNQRSMIRTKSTYTPQVDEDKNNGEKYLHPGKTVDMKGVEESLLLGVRIQMMREKGELSQKKCLQLRCHVIKIKNCFLEVTKGYSKHYEEINNCPPPKHHLKKIKVLFDQRIEHRCAKYNLTKEEEEQWEPSNINSNSDKHQIPMTNLRSMIQTKLTYIPQAKAKMRTKMMVRNTYILVRKLPWRGLRNGIGLVRKSWE
jgi:hypothetical protein